MLSQQHLEQFSVLLVLNEELSLKSRSNTFSNLLLVVRPVIANLIASLALADIIYTQEF